MESMRAIGAPSTNKPTKSNRREVSMADTPETIYLIPGEDVDGAPCMVWCDDPAPSYACDPAEAVKYVRADVHQELVAEARTEKDSAMDAETVA